MKRNMPLVALLCVLCLAAAGRAQTTQTVNLKVGGASRSFVVHVPSGVNRPPVVYFVHGYGGNGGGFANDTKGDKVADREKFIAVYPSAVSGAWSMYDTADYPYLRAILDTVDARYKVDRNRVYCTGFSQGGFISFGVGYKHPEIFAAVAPVSGHVPSFSTSAPLKRPVPMFLTFGTKDISDVASFMKDVDTWLRLDSCDKSSYKKIRPYPANHPRSVIARITYACAQGSEVAIDSVIGGGHEWAMDTVTKVNTTEETWAFLKRFTLSTTTSVGPRSSTNGASFLARYAAGKVRVEGVSGAVLVTDIRGATVAIRLPVDGVFAFEGYPRGVYFARNASRVTSFLVP